VGIESSEENVSKLPCLGQNMDLDKNKTVSQSYCNSHTVVTDLSSYAGSRCNSTNGLDYQKVKSK